MENNILTNEKSYAISVVRCCAMLSIILCHVFNEIPKISFLGQFFNVGIVLFMIISGYLYGKKNIIDVRKWIVKRFKTICVPIYVYYVLTFLLYSILKINQPFEIKKSIIAIFNMQGIVNGGLSNIILSHLWFITYILICYCITPFLQYMRKKGKKNIYAFIITSIVIVAILQLKIGVQNVWTIIYYITAYFGSSFRKNIVSNKKAYFMIIFAIIMRLFMKYVLGIYDKFYVLNLLYENIIVPILQWILGIGIFFTIYYMSIRYYDSLKYINKQVKKIDSMSYYIYIVHYMFLVGELSVIKLMGNLFLGMGVFIVFTVIYALIIKKITDYIVDRRK